VNLRNIWQAAYTAGTILPKPIATAQYWHRSLNPKKLIEVQFSRLGVCPPPPPNCSIPVLCDALLLHMCASVHTSAGFGNLRFLPVCPFQPVSRLPGGRFG